MMQITTPTLILDTEKAKNNIKWMEDKAAKHGIRLRPHFKTHQSAEIGSWFNQGKKDRITVSSVDMALYFAENGWKDITIAFPFNVLEAEKLKKIPSYCQIGIIVIELDTAHFLENRLDREFKTWIKIDTGYNRTGIESEDIEYIQVLLDFFQSSKVMNFEGFMVHSGHTYNTSDLDKINKIHRQSIDKLLKLKKRFGFYYPNMKLSIGDTPSASLCENFEGADELRPGNFVFYDVMQYLVGACSADQIAVAMACPVVAKHAQRNEIVLYGGAIHFSKDQVKHPEYGVIYGLPVYLSNGKWGQPIPNSYMIKLSQEHGILKADKALMDRLQVGDVIGILPVHSCLTADLMKSYQDDEGQVYTMMNSPS